MKNYLKTKCEKKDSNFWNTVKPFLSKRNNSSENIILSENYKIINNQKEISEIMNDYYINVAKDIGQNQNIDVTEHPSTREGHGEMVRARSFANVAACRAVSNPAWCRIFREISCFSPLNIGTLF